MEIQRPLRLFVYRAARELGKDDKKSRRLPILSNGG
jgi:hypothetical protein